MTDMRLPELPQARKQIIMSRILKAIPSKSAQMMFYASAMGAIALTAGADLPPQFVPFLSGAGYSILADIIGRVAKNDDKVSDDEIRRQVKLAIQKSNFEQLLTSHEFQRALGKLEDWKMLLEYAIKQNEHFITRNLIDQALLYRSLAEELQAGILAELQLLATRVQASEIIALLNDINKRIDAAPKYGHSEQTTFGDYSPAIGPGSTVKIIYPPSPPKQPDHIPEPQVPEPEIRLVGRLKEIEWLVEKITRQNGGVIGLSGMGGVGKTTLWEHVVDNLRDKFSGRFLSYTLEENTEPETVLQYFADSFGYRDFVAEATDLQQKKNRVRQILAKKKMLIVLDNARDYKQIKPLIIDRDQHVTLVVTRNRRTLAKVARQEHILHIEPLGEEDSLMLLEQALENGRERVSAELDEAHKTIEFLGRLPLALTIVAGYLDPPMTFEQYNVLLTDEAERLGLEDWDDPDKSVEASISLSYNHPSLTQDEKQLFTYLSVFAGYHFDVEAVAAVAVLPLKATLAMGHLQKLSLLEVHKGESAKKSSDSSINMPVRYKIHQLIKDFAKKQIGADWGRVYRKSVLHFIKLAQDDHFPNQYFRLDVDWENITGIPQWAYENQEWEILARISQALTKPNAGVIGFMDARGYWRDAKKMLTRTLKNADLPDSLQKAATLTKSGAFSLKLSKLKEAEDYLTESLELLNKLASNGDVPVETRLQQAYLYEQMARLKMLTDPQAAKSWLAQGLTILENASEEQAKYQQGNLYVLQSTLYARMGDFADANASAEDARKSLPPSAAKINALLNLANLAWMSGRLEESIAYSDQGIQIAEDLRDRNRLAKLKLTKGTAEAHRGNLVDSNDLFQEALVSFEEIGDIHHTIGLHSNLGLNNIVLGNETEAQTHLENVIELAKKHKLEEQEAMGRTNLAVLQIEQSQLKKAKRHLDKAKKIFERLELNHQLPEVLTLQAQIALVKNNPPKATALIKDALAKTGENVLRTGIAWRVKGDISQTNQESTKAEEAYQKSISLLSGADETDADNPHPYELAKSRVALAQYYLTDGITPPEEIMALITEALTEFKRLGAKHDIARAETLLEQFAE